MIYDKVITVCRNLLLNFPEAQSIVEYVDKRLSKEAQEKFCFGYFPSNKYIETLLSDISASELSDNSLLYEKIIQDGVANRKVKHSTMEHHNLIMPYRDVYGKIIALVGRSILCDEERKILNIPKYKNTSFKKGQHLFGLFESKETIIKNNIVYIVEGQFDCIKAHEQGLENIVALGCSDMTFDQFALINRYTDNITLLLDNDLAGNAGSNHIIEKFSKFANIKNMTFPGFYKDLDSYLSDNLVKDFSFLVNK